MGVCPVSPPVSPPGLSGTTTVVPSSLVEFVWLFDGHANPNRIAIINSNMILKIKIETPGRSLGIRSQRLLQLHFRRPSEIFGKCENQLQELVNRFPSRPLTTALSSPFKNQF